MCIKGKIIKFIVRFIYFLWKQTPFGLTIVSYEELEDAFGHCYNLYADTHYRFVEKSLDIVSIKQIYLEITRLYYFYYSLRSIIIKSLLYKIEIPYKEKCDNIFEQIEEKLSSTYDLLNEYKEE